MKLTEADLRHLSTLSRIELEPEAVPALLADLNRILDFAEVLGEVSLDEEPYGLDSGGNILRADEPGASLTQEAALELAPAARDGFYQVPRTVDAGDGHG